MINKVRDLKTCLESKFEAVGYSDNIGLSKPGGISIYTSRVDIEWLTFELLRYHGKLEFIFNLKGEPDTVYEEAENKIKDLWDCVDSTYNSSLINSYEFKYIENKSTLFVYTLFTVSWETRK